MILKITGVPAYVEPTWPRTTEAWLFCSTDDDLEELIELGKALGYTEWRPNHCPPHWRISDDEAGLLDTIPAVDSLTMTLHCRVWRRIINDRDLPKPKSHKKSCGRPAGA